MTVESSHQNHFDRSTANKTHRSRDIEKTVLSGHRSTGKARRVPLGALQLMRKVRGDYEKYKSSQLYAKFFDDLRAWSIALCWIQAGLGFSS